jgi:putative sterol carrier protein
MVHFMGGFVAAQIGLQSRHLEELDGEIGEFADKTAEDFYRAVHKKRKYVIPTDCMGNISQKTDEKTEVDVLVQSSENGFIPSETELTKSENIQSQLNNFTDSQEKEIEELSFLFAKKYSNDAEGEKLLTEGADALNELNSKTKKAAKPAKTVSIKSKKATQKPDDEPKPAEKLTLALPERFRSGLSAGLQATIQINISGGEEFDGYLHIHSTECTYTKGNAPAPDITIMADSAVWLDVLNGKSTAQKAFMIGGIKVRGDFVLLTKFDTLFAK